MSNSPLGEELRCWAAQTPRTFSIARASAGQSAFLGLTVWQTLHGRFVCPAELQARTSCTGLLEPSDFCSDCKVLFCTVCLKAAVHKTYNLLQVHPAVHLGVFIKREWTQAVALLVYTVNEKQEQGGWKLLVKQKWTILWNNLLTYLFCGCFNTLHFKPEIYLLRIKLL